jgi:hypothetical protein
MRSDCRPELLRNTNHRSLDNGRGVKRARGRLSPCGKVRRGGRMGEMDPESEMLQEAKEDKSTLPPIISTPPVLHIEELVESNRSETFIRPLSVEAIVALVLALVNLALDQADIHIMLISWLSVMLCTFLCLDVLRRTKWGAKAGYRSKRFISACALIFVAFVALGLFLSRHKRSMETSQRQGAAAERSGTTKLAEGNPSRKVDKDNTSNPRTNPEPNSTAPLGRPSLVNPGPTVSAAQAVRPYDLPDERRSKFLALLKPPIGADTLRIGCLAWSEHACVSAGRFLVLFSEAGWTIDGNKVFRLDNSIPNEGVSLVSLPEPGPPLPPHLGRWHAMDSTEITLLLAFTKMGLKPNESTDSSLSRTITGVYFGPEPLTMRVDKRDLQIMQVMEFISESGAIESRTSGEAGTALQDENDWDARVQNWLRSDLGEPTTIQFRKTLGIEAKRKFLISVGQRLHPQSKQQ